MLEFPKQKYKCIIIDPPWPHRMVGKWNRPQHINLGTKLPYETMTLEQIQSLPIMNLSEDDTHLWLWTTNAFLCDAYNIVHKWGFTVLAPITWVKPSGLGAWFAHTTQHVLFAYNKKCVFPLKRYKPTHFFASPVHHSAKPEEFYDLVRSISPKPRIDLFNRRYIRGFDGWGDQSPY